MFGVIVSGRPVDSSPTILAEAQFAFKISPTPTFSHIVVFVLPGTRFPPGTAATVFVQIPPSQDFKLLGGIGPGKESAIFKVSGLKGPRSADADGDAVLDDIAINASSLAPGDITVGVSIEPVQQVEAQISTLKQPVESQGSGSLVPSTGLIRHTSSSGGRTTTKLLAQRIIGNAFNFLASFGSDTVPLKAFQDWWIKFEKKVELDPSFLEREDQG